ncbi:MAG: ATP-binding protein, partial [Eubacteriales bacterium]
AAIQEREQMARNMHDNLGQVLSYTNVQLQGIRQELVNAGVEIATDRIDRIISVIQEAHIEVRDYIKSVRNSLYIERDFVSELVKEILGFEHLTGIKVKLDIPDGFNGAGIRPVRLKNILKIVKEALSNIRKHAEADNIRVSFLLSQEQMCVAVEDNGKGFDINDYGNKMGNKYGLIIMRERAEEIGAQFNIESTLGKGSRVVLNVPIRESEK